MLPKLMVEVGLGVIDVINWRQVAEHANKLTWILFEVSSTPCS